MSDAMIDELAGLFSSREGQTALGDRVSLADHMLQAAARAELAGADDALVAAALLHDIGHLLYRRERDRRPGVDDRHEEVGARFLEPYFRPHVTEPIRLHVAAKRYLCAVEDGYGDVISAASHRTLALQGGPMTPDEARAFERETAAESAIAVRRWDDYGKAPGRPVPGFEHFRPLLRRLL